MKAIPLDYQNKQGRKKKVQVNMDSINLDELMKTESEAFFHLLTNERSEFVELHRTIEKMLPLFPGPLSLYIYMRLNITRAKSKSYPQWNPVYSEYYINRKLLPFCKSQSKIAEFFGVSEKTIYNWIETLKKLKALKHEDDWAIPLVSEESREKAKYREDTSFHMVNVYSLGTTEVSQDKLTTCEIFYLDSLCSKYQTIQTKQVSRANKNKKRQGR